MDQSTDTTYTVSKNLYQNVSVSFSKSSINSSHIITNLDTIRQYDSESLENSNNDFNLGVIETNKPDDISTILKDIKLRNVKRLTITSLNINYVANKFEQLKIIETKIDDTFPTSQFLIEGYSKPYRQDRNRYGGGIIIFIRDDLPSKLLSRHTFSHDRKEKLLLFGTYLPPSQSDLYYFEQIGQSLDVYNRDYNKAGGFNASEKCLSSFLFEYGFKNLIKEKTCSKNPNNPSSIDLFLINAANSFQNTVAIT